MTAIPPGWCLARLCEICEPVTKHNPADRPDEVIQYIDIGGIEDQAIVDFKEMLGRDAPSRARQLVSAGDTVLSTVRTYLRKTAMVQAELDGATASTGFCVLRPALGIDPRFLFYRVTDSSFVDTLTGLQTGSSYPAVRDRDVFEREISVPPTAEQRRIVEAIEERLSRLDVGATTLARARRNIKRMRASLLQAAVDGELISQDSGDEPARTWLAAHGKDADDGVGGEELPTGWARTTFGRLKTWSVYGPRFSSDDYVPDGIPVLRTTDITPSGRVIAEQAPKLALSAAELDKYRVCPGDIVMTRTGATIGKAALIADETAAIPGAYLILYRFGLPLTVSEFLLMVLQSPKGQWQLIGKGAGVGRPNLNAPSIDATIVDLPPLAELHRIVDEVKRVLSATDALEKSLETQFRRSHTLRSSVLSTAFSGRLVPQDPRDEPAARLLERIALSRTSQPKLSGRRKRVPA